MIYICPRQIESILIIRNLGLTAGFLILTSFTTKVVPELKLLKKKNTEQKNTTITITIPFLQKDFIGFKEALAFKESQGKYSVVNKFGYLGKYQFGKNTLRRLKIYNTKSFLKKPELQEKAFTALCSINKWILRKDIKRFEGKYINGVLITESGIIAAAHLAGAGNVKKHLRSYGKFKFKDGFGTSISSYMKKFAGYDVSNLKANKLAKV